MALVMVLGALTILTIMLTEFQDETSAEFGSALSARDAIQAEYAARSAINLSRLYIASEPTIRSALAILFLGKTPAQIPIWDFTDQVLGAFNDEAGHEKFTGLSGVDLEEGENLGLDLPGVSFEVQVVDEDSKINLNRAWRDELTKARLATELLGLMTGPQFDPLFENRDADGHYSDRQAVCSAIIDWIDPNQDQAPCDPQSGSVPNTGPEDSFYQLLKQPYQRKNAPLDSLEELHLVRGVGDDFWATFIDPDPSDPGRRNVTVWGQGQVNVNTANPQTLLALVCGRTQPPAKVCSDPEQTIKFLTVLNAIKGFMPGFAPFGSPKAFLNALKHKGNMMGPALQALGIDPIQPYPEAEFLKTITTESKVFSIYATGIVKVAKRETRVRLHAVVDFRGAPSPPEASEQMMRKLGEEGYLTPEQAEKAVAEVTEGLPEELGDDALAQIFKPDPAGRIVYFRVN